MRQATRLAVAVLAALIAAGGCDCGGGELAGDGDDRGDVPTEAIGDGADADADSPGEASADADAAGDGGGTDDGWIPPDAWPDAPPTCEWYELRSAFDEPCSSGDSWVRDPFYAPSDEPMLRLVSVYETSTVSGPLTVRLRRAYRPVVLALGSYESVTWTIEREEGARLEAVYVYGYDPQTVVGADDVPVTNHSPRGRHPGYCYPFCSDHDTRRDVAEIEAEIGLAMQTFDGCYRATGITLGAVCREECLPSAVCAGRECGYVADCGFECGTCAPGTRCDGAACVACTPSCAGRECGTDGCGGSCGDCPDGRVCDSSGRCVPETTFPGCEDIALESHYCLTLSEGRPALLGLDSGIVCPFGKPDLDLGDFRPDRISIGFADGNLFLCVDRPGMHGLVRYSILDELVAIAPVPCGGVAAWRDALITMGLAPLGLLDGLTYFTSFDDALDGVGETWPWGFMLFPWLTVQGDLLYASSRSASGIDVHSLPSGEVLRTVTLEGMDGSYLCAGVTEDGLLVVNASWPEDRVAIFDEATGVWLRDVTPSGPVGGLVCFVGP